MVNVEPQDRLLFTSPFLPPLEEYVPYLERIWSNKWLTNQGELARQLEQKLQSYHDLDSAVYGVANGGLGLQIALKALGVERGVITTPFSYVATASYPVWEGCSVKFADIDPDSLNLSTDAVAASITPATEAILATHVFGNPCDVEGLAALAARHGLALIYDAAHAFGVRYEGKSILEWGDVSVVSTHATKVFQTGEGGFMTASDTDVAAKIEWMRRYGHKNFGAFHGVGINGKLSELHAAMGLCVFEHLESASATRRKLVDAYHDWLREQEGVRFAMKLRPGTEWNCSYYPILFETESEVVRMHAGLESLGIDTRRYFYPALHRVPGLGVESDDLPNAESIASRVLCLPLSSQMQPADQQRVLRGFETTRST